MEKSLQLKNSLPVKQGVRYNTKVGYNFVLNLVKKEDFAYRQIRDIKVSDAQQWIMKLHNDGKGYSTITSVRGVVKPAFQMAYNEDIIRRNPFDFKLVDVVPNDSQKRIAMTAEQQELWMSFIREDKTYMKYYDEFVVLLGTGMRVRVLRLTKERFGFCKPKNPGRPSACPGAGRKILCGKNKTECGCRYISMTEEVFQSLNNLLARRKKVKTEIVVDGYNYTCNEILNTLRSMQVTLLSKESGYIPSYRRTDLTDDLHKAFGFHTDYEFISKSAMRSIIKSTKTEEGKK